MNAQNVIDVNPISATSERFGSRAHTAADATSHDTWRAPSYARTNGSKAAHHWFDNERNPFNSDSPYNPTNCTFDSNTNLGSAIGGFCEIGVGGLMMLVGIPMLILPGPGLLAIFAGGALVLDGFRRVTGQK